MRAVGPGNAAGPAAVHRHIMGTLRMGTDPTLTIIATSPKIAHELATI